MNKDRETLTRIDIAISRYFEDSGRMRCDYEEMNIEDRQNDLLHFIEGELKKADINYKEKMMCELDFNEDEIYG